MISGPCCYIRLQIIWSTLLYQAYGAISSCMISGPCCYIRLQIIWSTLLYQAMGYLAHGVKSGYRESWPYNWKHNSKLSFHCQFPMRNVKTGNAVYYWIEDVYIELCWSVDDNELLLRIVLYCLMSILRSGRLEFYAWSWMGVRTESDGVGYGERGFKWCIGSLVDKRCCQGCDG